MSGTPQNIITGNPVSNQTKVGESAMWLLVICPEATVNSLQKASSWLPGGEVLLEESQEDAALFNWELNIFGIAPSKGRALCCTSMSMPRWWSVSWFSPAPNSELQVPLSFAETPPAKAVFGFPTSFPIPSSPSRPLLPLNQIFRGPHSESQRLATY